MLIGFSLFLLLLEAMLLYSIKLVSYPFLLYSSLIYFLALLLALYLGDFNAPKRTSKKDDIIYLSVFVLVFLIALRNYMLSPPYTLGDTTILPPTNPGLYTPSTTIQYYLSLLMGENNLIKTLNFLAFLIAPISIYFTLGRKGDLFKRLILPLIFTLNPISISIFYTGDGESILLVYSLQPLVYYLTHKMLYDVKNKFKYLIYLGIVEVIGQIFFFQMFLFSFFFQLPFILLSIKEKKYLFFFILF